MEQRKGGRGDREEEGRGGTASIPAAPATSFSAVHPGSTPEVGEKAALEKSREDLSVTSRSFFRKSLVKLRPSRTVRCFHLGKPLSGDLS
jgi:hypothetical protein